MSVVSKPVQVTKASQMVEEGEVLVSPNDLRGRTISEIPTPPKK